MALYLGQREPKPSALTLWITSRTRLPPMNVTALFATADDPLQQPALFIVGLAHTYSFCHPHDLTTARFTGSAIGGKQSPAAACGTIATRRRQRP